MEENGLNNALIIENELNNSNNSKDKEILVYYILDYFKKISKNYKRNLIIEKLSYRIGYLMSCLVKDEYSKEFNAKLNSITKREIALLKDILMLVRRFNFVSEFGIDKDIAYLITYYCIIENCKTAYIEENYDENRTFLSNRYLEPIETYFGKARTLYKNFNLME